MILLGIGIFYAITLPKVLLLHKESDLITNYIEKKYSIVIGDKNLY